MTQTVNRLRRIVPADGIRATLVGGNTIGAMLRESGPRADGYRHIDTPALVARLQELGVDTYLYGIWDSPTDFADLREEFLPAAAAAGIDVWLYIVPPSETRDHGRGSRPYLTDYVAWARAIAELSLEHRNLKAWAIDDFEDIGNVDLFTPEYIAEMRRTQDAINPALGFLTCAYHGAATSDDFLDRFGPYLDGIIHPFLDGFHANTQVASTVVPYLEEIRAKTAPRGLGVILLVYSGRFLDAPLAPTEDYVAAAVAAGLGEAAAGRIEGVVAYGTQLDDAPTPATDNRAMYGRGRLAFCVPNAVDTPAGTYVEASQVVTVDPAAPRHELSFWRLAAMPRSHVDGKHLLQVLLDGELVFSLDVADQSWPLWTQGEALQGPVDVTAQLRGKSTATLAFRLTEAAAGNGAAVDVGVDHVETIGFTVANPGFETPDSWHFDATHPAMLGCIDIFVPDRPARIFEAVQRLYRDGQRPASADGAG